MRTLSFPYSPLVLVVLIAVVAFKPVFADEPELVDPITGETIAISDLDFQGLSDEERADIGDRLAEPEISLIGRGRDRVELSEVEVVDPTTGETVDLGDVDRPSLSDEDRENIGDQLAEQGINVGRHGARGGEERADDAEANTDAGVDAENGRGGRGGAGQGGNGGGGRGGPRD